MPRGGIAVLTALALSPFLFGAVHPTPFFLICAVLLLGAATTKLERVEPLATTLGALIAIWLAFGIVNSFINPTWNQSWPIPTIIGAVAAWAAFRTGLVIQRSKFHTIAIGTGTLCAALALIHWPMDNGRLFGIFEPRSMFVSERARWPFVNPNHLAIFLLVPLSISICSVLDRISTITASSNSRRPLYEQLHNTLPALIVSVVPPLLMTCAIVLTLSRNGWASTVLVLAIGFVTTSRIASGALRAGLLAAFLALSVGLVLGTSARARIAVEERVVKAFTASTTDPRWELVTASHEMLRESPLFGSGWGSWAARFELQKPHHLAALLPEHAHNDPLQFLVENGLIGSLPVLALVALMANVVLRTAKSSRNRVDRWVAAGLIGVAFSSLFDFPFHIPAIFLWFAFAAGTLASTTLDTHRE